MPEDIDLVGEIESAVKAGKKALEEKASQERFKRQKEEQDEAIRRHIKVQSIIQSIPKRINEAVKKGESIFKIEVPLSEVCRNCSGHGYISKFIDGSIYASVYKYLTDNPVHGLAFELVVYRDTDYGAYNEVNYRYEAFIKFWLTP